MSTGFASHTTQPEQLYNKFLEDRHYDDNDVQALGLELLSKEQTKELIGHTYEPSVKIPYRDLDGNDTGFHRVRLLAPKSKMKYSQARASGSHVYFPPCPKWRQYTTNVDIPIIITEGEFKAWTIQRHLDKHKVAYGVIGLAGVTSWTDKSGLHLHKDLMQFAWKRKTDFDVKNRQVYIIFDYDGKKEDGEPNDQVALAETKLAIVLRGLGAVVHLCRVGRFGPGVGVKYAIDDHLGQGGSLTDVLNSTSITMNGVDTLDVKLYEFSTKYALYNGDVIRLSDGHIMPFQKAKIDSAQHIYISQTVVPASNNRPAKTVVKEIAMIDEYKKWRKRCDIRKVGIFPQYQGLQITPDGCYNYLNSWSHLPIQGDPAPYLDFCKYFFRDEPEFETYWHDWIANVVQYPHRRNNTTPQFVSSQEGIGKSAIAEFVAEMMGLGENGPAIIAGPDELFGSFNGLFRNKIFVVVNEPSSDREDHSKQLKSMITGKEIAINNKYGAQYNIDNYMNFVFTSNDAYITRMGNTARREAIYHPTTLTNKETHPKVTSMMQWARQQGGFGIVLNWYYERDISKFDPAAPAPDTKYRQTAIDASKTPLQAFAQELSDWLTAHCDGMGAFTTAQLETLCETWGHDSRPRAQYIRKALLGYGEIEAQKVIKVHGKSARYTVFRVTNAKAELCNHGALTDLAKKTEDAIMNEIAQKSIL